MRSTPYGRRARNTKTITKSLPRQKASNCAGRHRWCHQQFVHHQFGVIVASQWRRRLRLSASNGNGNGNYYTWSTPETIHGQQTKSKMEITECVWSELNICISSFSPLVGVPHTSSPDVHSSPMSCIASSSSSLSTEFKLPRSHRPKYVSMRARDCSKNVPARWVQLREFASYTSFVTILISVGEET